MFAGSRMPCQWIELSSGSVLCTRSVTVSPSRQRSTGAGSDPFIVMAFRARPVKLTGVSPMVRLKSLPRWTTDSPLPASDQAGCGHPPRAATAPPAASPVTKSRRVQPLVESQRESGLDVLLRVNLEGNQCLRAPDARELTHLLADHPCEILVLAHPHQRDEIVLPGDGEHPANALALGERRYEFRNLVGLRPDQHDCGDHQALRGAFDAQSLARCPRYTRDESGACRTGARPVPPTRRRVAAPDVRRRTPAAHPARLRQQPAAATAPGRAQTGARCRPAARGTRPPWLPLCRSSGGHRLSDGRSRPRAR